MTFVKRRRDIVDILGFDVAGIVKNTAMASNTVMAYSTLSPLSAGSKNTKTFRMDIKHIGRIYHQNIAIFYIHIALHLFLFCYGINQLINIFKLLNLDIPILNVVIVSE